MKINEFKLLMKTFFGHPKFSNETNSNLMNHTRLIPKYEHVHKSNWNLTVFLTKSYEAV